MYFSREQIYSELKRLYDVYTPYKRPHVNIGRPQLEDDQVTIYTSYRWKGSDGRWYITNYYMGKYMDMAIPGGSDSEGYYSTITFDPYVPDSIGKQLNNLWNEEMYGFVDILGNKLAIEYHYKNREAYVQSFLPRDLST